MVQNRSELEEALRGRLGAAFARHAYGMRRWVELFAARLPSITDPEIHRLVAQIVADNASHAELFRRRALAHGVDPDGYRCSPEGEAVYARLEPLELREALAYALGSLEHFAELLDLYAGLAEDEADRAVLEQVRSENERSIARLRERPRTSSTGCASWRKRRAMQALTESANPPTPAELRRALPVLSPRGLRFRGAALASRVGALLSEGLRIGYRYGFDSGPFMAHVYANEPRGRTPLGRAIDRALLGRATCRAFREIRAL